MMTPLPTAARYLDARVMTASQPELQLMLLDGALRCGRQAQQLGSDDRQLTERSRLLGRTMDIVEALIYGVSGGSTAIAKRLEEEYAFVFRQLGAAQLTGDEAALEAALRILAIERETWKLAVEKLRQNGESDALGSPARGISVVGALGPLDGLSPQGSGLSLQG